MSRIHKTFSKSINMRGIILDEMIEVERLIDDFLSIYFTADDTKENELKEMLWNTERITLGAKKDILFIIIQNHYKTWLKNFPKFIPTLESIIPHRNIFAHLEVDLDDVHDTPSNEPIELVFKKYRSGKLSKEIYTEQRLLGLQNDFMHLKLCIINLITTTRPPY